MSDGSPPLSLWGVPTLAGERFVPVRRHQLLAWLAMRSGQWHARDEAAALLWPGHPGAEARRNLRRVIVDARVVAGVHGLEADPHALRWTVATDLDSFDALLRVAPPRLDEALALRRGALLEGLDEPANPAWSDWLQAERVRCDLRWQRAAHERLRLPGDTAGRAALAQAVLAVDPLDDAAMAVWLESCIAQGLLTEARQSWRAYADRLASELGIEPPARLRALLQVVEGAPAALPADDAPSAVPAAPPAKPASEPAHGPTNLFVGRKAELADLRGMLSRPEQRLVTLLGPGGVGKSRFAREALPALCRATGTSALSVALHDLADSGGLAARLAPGLALVLDDRRDAVAQIAAALEHTPRLLLLDNAEHLPDLPAWLGRLLAAAPGTRVLVTSRQRLGLPGETVLALQGLAWPDEDSRDIEAAPSFDAVRLFAMRASAALPGFVLDKHLEAVISIVQQCDGWPLAIELAAAWVRLLPPEEIARELRHSIDVLERDPASAAGPARPEHSSLRVVLERTWQLLAPREREAIEGLAVMRSAFTRATAQAVAGVALPLLAALVDRGLLGVSEAGRFSLHPLVAAFALQRLQADPPREAAQRERHAGHFLRALAELQPRFSLAPREVLGAVQDDEPDLQQAWSHALALRRADWVAPALPMLSVYHQRSGQLRRGAAMLQAALSWPADAEGGDLVQGRARAAVARLWFMARDPLDTVQDMADSALVHARRANDRLAQMSALSVRATCDSERGRFDDARLAFEQVLVDAEALGDVVNVVRCMRSLGSVATRRGDFEAGLAWLRRTGARAREAGLLYEEVDALLAQAGPHLERAEWAEAERVLDLSLRRAAAIDARQLMLHGRLMRGCALIELGRLDEARADLQLARTDTQVLKQPALAMYVDNYMALADLREGRLAEAEAALRAVAVLARDGGWPLESMRALLFHGEVLARRGERLAAARAWQALAQEPTLAAGERDTARQWLAGLALDGDEAVRLAATEPLPVATLVARLASGGR